MNDRSSALVFDDVVKDYGDTRALHGVSFDVREREFFTLLGPSGCGKTTLLRLVAGFERLSAGRITLSGEDVSALPPAKRPVNTVFQHYALFPHLSVVENVGFGLKMLGWDAAAVEKRAVEMLDLVKLGDFASRPPAQLSGGQQQRVALARAMAPEPRVLLLDEPLSALDLKLRQAMRSELKLLQQESGITFVFVTHDQEEALAMSDRIAVMAEGRVQQLGTPRDIYEQPVNAFVADFIGQSNVIDVVPKGERWAIDGAAYAVEAAGTARGSSAQLSIRPERFTVLSGHHSDRGWCGTVRHASYLGGGLDLSVELDSGPVLQVRVSTQDAASELAATGSAITLQVGAGAARLLD